MTSFQDLPPQSRRALRQGRSNSEEIDDSADAVRAPSGRRARAAEPDGLVQVPNADQANADGANADQASADQASVDLPNADLPNATQAAYNDEPVDAAGAQPDEAAAVTDSAVPKAFPFAEQVEATSDDAGHPGFRLRDFSPELSTSRVESQSAHDWTPGADQESVPLDYQTQGGPAFGYVSPYAERGPESPTAQTDAEPDAAAEPSFDSLFSDLLAPEPTVDENIDVASAGQPAVADEAFVPLGEPVVVAEPVAPVEPIVAAQEERTLSRREWRAMRAKAEAEAEAAAAPADDVAVAENPVVEVEPVSDVEELFQRPELTDSDIPPLIEPEAAPQNALSDAMAEFEALTRGGQPTAEPVASAFPSLFADPAPERTAEPVVPEPVVPAAVVPAPIVPAPIIESRAEPENVQPEAVEPEVAPAAAPRAPFSFLVSGAATPAAEQTDPGAYTPPVGHWSRQAQMDDESQPFENTLSRDVGGGNVATTTNALVLPMIPQRDDFSSVLNATGEIMVTGTINLPGSVGSTGRDSRHYDDPEVDHLFDAFDTEIANTDSAPVRAITAVSSHTATRGGIESGRKQSNRMLNVLLVTACVMAAAVAGLLIAGFVFKIF